jgi:hypothetical protein
MERSKILFSSCLQCDNLLWRLTSPFWDLFDSFEKYDVQMQRSAGSTPTFKQLFLKISAKAGYHTSETIVINCQHVLLKIQSQSFFLNKDVSTR